MGNSTDIVGYTFNTDNYCPEDMKGIAIAAMVGSVPDCFRLDPKATTEMVLDVWAKRMEMARQEAESYGSTMFPLAITRDQLETEEIIDVCGRCQNPLGD